MRWLSRFSIPLFVSCFALSHADSAIADEPAFGDVLTTVTDDQRAVPGFLEPFRTARLAALETGAVAGRPVAEGDRVTRGQLLYQLDQDTLLARLAIAQHEASRTSSYDAAKTELAVKERRMRSLEEIAAAGHSADEELMRAKADVALAEANLRSAEEQRDGLALEVRRIEAELNRRRVTSPIDGFVTDLTVDVGESIGRTDDVVAVVVQLDRLRATFYVPAAAATAMSHGQKASVRVHDPARGVHTTDATIEYVAPVTKADSGTVRIRVVIDNTAGQWRSGSACELILNDPPTPVAGRIPSGRG